MVEVAKLTEQAAFLQEQLEQSEVRPTPWRLSCLVYVIAVIQPVIPIVPFACVMLRTLLHVMADSSLMLCDTQDIAFCAICFVMTHDHCAAVMFRSRQPAALAVPTSLKHLPLLTASMPYVSSNATSQLLDILIHHFTAGGYT